MTLFLALSGAIILVSLGFLAFNSKDLRQWQVFALIIIAPLLVAIIYPQIGTPNAITFQAPDNANTNDVAELLSRNQLGPEQIQRAIDSLQTKLDENPDDIQSLNLLANTYLITEQVQLAVLTLEKLISLGQNDPDTLIKAADSYTFVEQGVINLRARQLLEAAIQQSPNHPQGLWLLGMAAVQSEENVKAKEYWTRLLPLIANTPQEQQLKNILAELELRQSGIANHALAPNHSAPSGQQINVQLSLGDSLRQEHPDVADSDTVFIFARAKEGPKAPLAVKRLTVADLPATVTLTEQDAMLPQATITQFEDIQISAKISKSGNPTIKEGDIDSQVIDINMQTLKDNYALEIQ